MTKTRSTNRAEPVLVTVRHPDFENVHHLFGDVETIDIELGSSFDASRIDPSNWDYVLEWAVGMYQTAADVENDEAAAFIRATAEETLAGCLPDGTDHCRVEPFIRRAARLTAWGMA